MNPIHAWPNKPSYEFRLAKYAYRGFAVSVPGFDASRLDFSRILKGDLKELKGLARLIKISSEVDTAPPFKTREYFVDEDAEGAIAEDWGDGEPIYYLQHCRPRIAREIKSLSRDEREALIPEFKLLEYLNRGYDCDAKAYVVVPSVYRNALRWFSYYNFINSPDFPITPESRIQAWQGILDAGEDHPKNVDRLLHDCWDTSKRSREYLNAQMDKYDLDNIYYAEAYRMEEA